MAITGSEHHLLLDDAAGGTGPKPIELLAVALAGCTAFDMVTILRQKFHQKVTGYEVRVEADQAERPPQVFTALRVHHVITGYDLDSAAIGDAIRLSEEKYKHDAKANSQLQNYLRDFPGENLVDGRESRRSSPLAKRPCEA